jgi:predicted Zn-ribbon and HTH transcriptional regulator
MIRNLCASCKYDWESSEPVVECPECRSDAILSIELTLPDKETD